MSDKEYPPVPKGYKGIFRVRPDKLEPSNDFYEAYGVTGEDIIEEVDYLEGKSEFTGVPEHLIRAAFYRTYEDLRNRENMIRGMPFNASEYLLYPISNKKNNYW